MTDNLPMWKLNDSEAYIFTNIRVDSDRALSIMIDTLKPYYVVCKIKDVEITHNDDFDVYDLYITFHTYEHMNEVNYAIAKIRKEEDI